MAKNRAGAERVDIEFKGILGCFTSSLRGKFSQTVVANITRLLLYGVTHYPSNDWNREIITIFWTINDPPGLRGVKSHSFSQFISKPTCRFWCFPATEEEARTSKSFYFDQLMLDILHWLYFLCVVKFIVDPSLKCFMYLCASKPYILGLQ